MAEQKYLKYLSLGGTIFTFFVIALGAFTRLIDAGLGCPDWPGCYGHLTVPSGNHIKLVDVHYPHTPLIAYKAWAEMVHRYFAGTLSCLIVLIIIFSLLYARKSGRRIYYAIPVWLFCLVLYQIVLGMWTVTLKLLPIIVSQHLLGGMLILSSLWSIYLLTTQDSSGTSLKHTRSSFDTSATGLPTISNLFSKLALLGLALLFLQLFLGAWTSTNYASLSCPDFPFCDLNQTFNWHLKEALTLFSSIGVNYDGGVLSTIVRQNIQMLHRIGALVVSLYWFVLIGVLITRAQNLKNIIKPALLILLFLLIQISLGISNVVFNLPWPVAVGHTLTAALLLLSIITLNFKLRAAS